MQPRLSSSLRRGLVASTWEGAFAQVFITLTSGVFVVRYAVRNGAGDAALGLLAAIPFLAQTLQLATAWVYERHRGARREITAWTLVVSRVVWVVPAALAAGWLAGVPTLPLLFATVAVSSLVATAGVHGWQSWMMDLVPASIRGRYFGLRNAVAALVAVATAWAGGRLLDALEGDRPGAGHAVTYAAAAVAGLLAWFAILRQHHPSPRRGPDTPPFSALWREAWSKPANRRVLAFFFMWNVALGCSAPFWVKFMDVELGLSAAAIGAQGTIGLVIGASLNRAWGRLVDRVGIRPVLLANAGCIAAIPFLWLFARPGFLLPVWADMVAVGVFWSGFNLAAFNVPLSVAPARGAAVFLGVFSAATGLAFGLSCLAGGAVAQALGPHSHDVLGLSLSSAQVMFLASGCLRALSLFLAVGLPDAKANRVVFLVQVMGYAVRQRLNVGRQLLFAPWRRRK